ncbi:hypothetical protein DFJ73DRAFT_842780 [Zopfochytrium polystomum]|nr:hypothetical protein DFJ73DRAFT_848225 [Zopfochytrium polystomum]KAI9342177.1 hypothetical protein DFJ73DRAFT_842780 [Zopfochytrium polystomum]
MISELNHITDTNIQPQGSFDGVMKALLKKLEPGDLFIHPMIDGGEKAPHHYLIYGGTENDGTEDEKDIVYHYSNKWIKEDIYTAISGFDLSLQKFRIVYFDESPEQRRINLETSLKNAKTLLNLGPKEIPKYDVFKSNCEQWAMLCRCGRYESLQLQKTLAGMGKAIVIVLIAVKETKK